MQKLKTKPIQQVFEARYERGYRYLDRCGDAILVLEETLNAETGKVWIPTDMQPRGSIMKCPELDIVISFTHERLFAVQQPMTVEADFSSICQILFATLVGRFDLRVFTRAGSRRIHIHGTDSITEANSLMMKLSPISRWPFTQPLRDFDPKEADIVTVQENESEGFRFELKAGFQLGAPEEIDERLKIPSRFLPKNQHEALMDQLQRQKQREKAPPAGVVFDIDYYWIRPPKIDVKAFLAGAIDMERDILQKF